MHNDDQRAAFLTVIGFLCSALVSCQLSAQEQPSGGATPHTLEEALKLLDDRPAWTQLDTVNFPIHPAQKYLKGMTIVLDPGHGGQAHKPGYKRGPTGVREAEMNYRLAKLLERLLTDAGVKVVLTRDSDTEVSLAGRAKVANTVKGQTGRPGADLFISIHHNASGPKANFTTVWFHGQADWSEPDLDAARYVAHALGAAIRTQVGVTSPLMSDQQMYDSGFGVLRHCQVPAILLECSFFSNPQEEQRLRDGIYNLREAYAVYRGLCEYAYGGRPTQTPPQGTVKDGVLKIETTLDDGLPSGWWGGDRNRIVTSTINAFCDGKRMHVTFDAEHKQLVAVCDRSDLAEDGPHTLSIHFTNFFKHHNWPQRYAVEPGTRTTITPLPARRFSH